MKLRILYVNANGLRSKGRYARFLEVCSRLVRKQEAVVFAVQEHNLNLDKHIEYERLAGIRNFTLKISYDKASPNGVHHGGTLILSDNSHITEEPPPNQPQLDPGITEARMDWGGEKVRLLNVYTPVDPDLRKNSSPRYYPNI